AARGRGALRPAIGRHLHGLQLLRAARRGAQPRHLHDPGAYRLCAPARAAVPLSRVLDRGLAQDELQDALSAAGTPGPGRLGARAEAVAQAALLFPTGRTSSGAAYTSTPSCLRRCEASLRDDGGHPRHVSTSAHALMRSLRGYLRGWPPSRPCRCRWATGGTQPADAPGAFRLKWERHAWISTCLDPGLRRDDVECVQTDCLKTDVTPAKAESRHVSAYRAAVSA